MSSPIEQGLSNSPDNGNQNRTSSHPTFRRGFLRLGGSAAGGGLAILEMLAKNKVAFGQMISLLDTSSQNSGSTTTDSSLARKDLTALPLVLRKEIGSLTDPVAIINKAQNYGLDMSEAEYKYVTERSQTQNMQIQLTIHESDTQVPNFDPTDLNSGYGELWIPRYFNSAGPAELSIAGVASSKIVGNIIQINWGLSEAGVQMLKDTSSNYPDTDILDGEQQVLRRLSWLSRHISEHASLYLYYKKQAPFWKYEPDANGFYKPVPPRDDFKKIYEPSPMFRFMA